MTREETVKAARDMIDRYERGQGLALTVAIEGDESTEITSNSDNVDHAITIVSAMVDGIECGCGDPACGLRTLKSTMRKAIDEYSGLPMVH